MSRQASRLHYRHKAADTTTARPQAILAVPAHHSNIMQNIQLDDFSPPLVTPQLSTEREDIHKICIELME